MAIDVLLTPHSAVMPVEKSGPLFLCSRSPLRIHFILYKKSHFLPLRREIGCSCLHRSFADNAAMGCQYATDYSSRLRGTHAVSICPAMFAQSRLLNTVEQSSLMSRQPRAIPQAPSRTRTHQARPSARVLRLRVKGCQSL